MKKLCTLTAGLLLSLTVLAQSGDEAMKAWQNFMTPGKMHKEMAKWDGTWTTEATMWMDPSAQPVTSKGSCTNKMILGGRYQQSNYKGNMMGMPFEGMGILAYDNAKKVLVSTWMDNMGTGIMKLEGTWIEQTKLINFSGTCTDPSTGREMNVRETYNALNDNMHVMMMYMPDASGKEFKTMEIKFTRNKK